MDLLPFSFPLHCHKILCLHLFNLKMCIFKIDSYYVSCISINWHDLEYNITSHIINNVFYLICFINILCIKNIFLHSGCIMHNICRFTHILYNNKWWNMWVVNRRVSGILLLPAKKCIVFLSRHIVYTYTYYINTPNPRHKTQSACCSYNIS